MTCSRTRPPRAGRRSTRWAPSRWPPRCAAWRPGWTAPSMTRAARPRSCSRAARKAAPRSAGEQAERAARAVIDYQRAKLIRLAGSDSDLRQRLLGLANKREGVYAEALAELEE